MPAQASGVTTLMDVLSELDPQGKQMDIAEVLTQQNEVLKDMHWEQGNSATGHKDGMRTSLPTPSFRALNSGVPLTKSGSTVVEETCSLLEDFSQVDRELAIMSGDVSRYRLRQANPHIIGMGHKQAATLFYGNNGTQPLEYTGFANRLNTLSTTTNKAAANVISAAGTGGSLRSIWVIVWGPDTVFGIYPRNTKGGLVHEDATNASGSGADGAPPAAVLQDTNGNMYMGYRDHWLWRCGLFVKDWRYICRVCNIDLTTLTLTGATGAKLQDLLVQATEQVESLTGGRAVIYMPRSLQTYFRRQLLEQKNAMLSWDEIGGEKILSFGGVPIRRTDVLNTNETQVI